MKLSLPPPQPKQPERLQPLRWRHEVPQKPVVIDAAQWFKNGDHPEDDHKVFDAGNGPFYGEGHVVRYFRRPDVPGHQNCRECNKAMHYHGWIDTKEGGHIVCPGN